MFSISEIKESGCDFILSDESEAPDSLTLAKLWEGAVCRSELQNKGSEPVRIHSVILFSIPHSLPPDTRIYGEGFQMLSQIGGTIGNLVQLGGYTDEHHYRLVPPKGAQSFYGMLSLSPSNASEPACLFAFTSCHAFSSRFDLYPDKLEAVIDFENLELRPGEIRKLEDLAFDTDFDVSTLFERLSTRIAVNHPPLICKAAVVEATEVVNSIECLKNHDEEGAWEDEDESEVEKDEPKCFPTPPTGWCSWYCFGPEVTMDDIRSNMNAIARNARELKYVQIDDGYQPAMGDWLLDAGYPLGAGVVSMLWQIHERGLEPALWVAPFIAEAGSSIFRRHPDWFVQDEHGAPLSSDRVTFGGWRRGPWYVLDGTHPEAQKHLEDTFREMSRDWACSYFKLDANFWGAIHGGCFHDPTATRIEAYRRGMTAILKGAGDSFVLGCNHPIWPSLGLIHGSRSSGDIDRSWSSIKETARENLSRNWQNGKLWWNDPDCLLLTGDLPTNEVRFHATALAASGGMTLSGDDLTKINESQLAVLRKLASPFENSALFTGSDLKVGTIKSRGSEFLCLLNWHDEPETIEFRLERDCELEDFWTDKSMGRFEAGVNRLTLLARSAMLLKTIPLR